MSDPPTIKDIIRDAILRDDESAWTAEEAAQEILDDLQLAGYVIITQEDLSAARTLAGEDIAEGAGPDAICGCGWAITWYEGEWLHVFGEKLAGGTDHDAEPDGWDALLYKGREELAALAEGGDELAELVLSLDENGDGS
jgi:hypothetical protein